jgi:hypothetical protein
VFHNLFTRRVDNIAATIDASLTDVLETVGEA